LAGRRLTLTATTLAAALVAAAIGIAFMLQPVPRPNVILISIDSLRPDHLGCYGYERDTSPVLDRIAREGVRFETVVSSSSWTLPSHAALFSSLPDRVHGCFNGSQWLDSSRQTVAEQFKEAGYETGGLFAGPWLHPVFGFHQGFDTYRDCTSYSHKTREVLESRMSVAEIGPLAHRDVTNSTVLREAAAWLDERHARPFFLFVHLWDVHFDYLPPDPYDRMFNPHYKGAVDGHVNIGMWHRRGDWTDADYKQFEALYDGEIRWTDATLGTLIDALRVRGMLDNTVIAVTADHGEAFFDHGIHGHGHSVHEEEIRIPLLIRFPPAVKAGTLVRRPVHLIDVAPTLLSLAGVPPLPDAMGRDLTPLVRSPEAPWPDTPLVSELHVSNIDDPQLALRTSTWKMIFHRKTNAFEIYDLARDPHEQQPLPEKRYPLAPGELHACYRDTMKKMEEAARRLPRPSKRPDIPARTKTQLRSLGYLK